MVKSRDVSSRRGKDHRYTINNTLQLRTLMLNFAVITFFFFLFRPDWNLHRRVYLFWVGMKEKGISVVNFSPLICLHVDISWSILDMRFLTVARYMCVRKSDVLLKYRRFVSCGCWSSRNKTSFTKIFKCRLISYISLTPSATSLWILLMTFSSRGWDIPATYRNKKLELWKCSLFQVGTP